MRNDVAVWERVVNKKKNKYDNAVYNESREAGRLKAILDRLNDANEAREILQSLAADIQQQSCEKISALVTKALRFVFGEHAYNIKIELTRARGRTEAAVRLVRDGMVLDPLSAVGGGMVDVVAFALRLCAVLLSRPSLRRILVLDEPFRFVSVEYRPKVRRLIEQLSDELGVQIIMITHDEVLACGDVIRLTY